MVAVSPGYSPPEQYQASKILTPASDIYAPASGKIVAVNEDLSGSPEKVNESPFEGGWLFQIEVSEEGAELMDAAAYEAQAN